MTSSVSEKLNFLNHKTRYKALFLLLLRAESYVKSDYLAEELAVTSRTIKNDITTLREDFAKVGIYIRAKQAKGYFLEITDKVFESQIKEFFQIYQSDTIDNEFDTSVQYILRRLLSADDPVKTEALQSELLVNTNNALSKEIEQVKEMLTLYDLQLAVRPRYGMFITGPVYKKSLLTVRMYKYFNQASNPDFGITAYNKLFACDEDERVKIRAVFYKTMVHSRVVFSDIYAERFILYLIYFRNQLLRQEMFDFQFYEIDFDYQQTEEYVLVVEITQKLRNQLSGFDFTEDYIQFLTYVAIMSTDLYRFKDCTEENYGSLVTLAEDARNFLLREMSDFFQIDVFDDYTCLKDLLKIMIPISLKIKLGVSDSLDIGYEDITSNEDNAILYFFILKVSDVFKEKYGYSFSDREQRLIFSVFLGMLNRITIDHRKLRLAIIAIDGRLSTQQLKFNLQHYFSEYIEKIETRVLYELNFAHDLTYDYYLCSNYGKNMNIDYKPIYFADENMTENEYAESLKHIFIESFDYDEVLPKIEFNELKWQDRFEDPIVAEFFEEQQNTLLLTGAINIHLIFDFNTAVAETFSIFYYPSRNDQLNVMDDYYIKVNLNIRENKQKLRMFLNVINKIEQDKKKLAEICHNGNNQYTQFLL